MTVSVMRWLTVAIASVTAVSATAPLAWGDDPPPRPVWSVSEGCDSPESVYHDVHSGLLYVSQMSGVHDKKDGQGWISRYDLNGKVVDAKWVTGLNAPKGVHSFKGTLWVSDIDELVAIDMAKGEIKQRIAVPGAKSLNDVACAVDGSVFVSDLAAQKIFQVSDGKVSVFAEGDDLESPNGLLVHDEQLIVAGSGLPEESVGEREAGHLFSLNFSDKLKVFITPQPVGTLDGLDFDGSGGYLLSDWSAGKVLQVTFDGEVRTILQLTKGTSDLAYVASKGLLIVPRMLDNKVEAYRLTDLTE